MNPKSKPKQPLDCADLRFVAVRSALWQVSTAKGPAGKQLTLGQRMVGRLVVGSSPRVEGYTLRRNVQGLPRSGFGYCLLSGFGLVYCFFFVGIGFE